ncbi:hypothetical protein AAZX31_19G019800 [Glycine max]
MESTGKFKDVLQGTYEKGQRFWKKFRILLCCKLLNSKGKDFVNDKNKQVQGKNVTNNMVRHQRVTQRSSSTKRSKRSSSTNLNQEIIEVSSLLRRFTFNDLKLATRNFESKNFLGVGGFGNVLKGWVNEHGNFAARPGTGIQVAVKTLNPNGFQGHKEWLAEISYLSELHHPNLVRLVGYCIEDDKRLLVYEYMCQRSLDKHLFKTTKHLTWPVRIKIAIGAANALAFLHEEASRPVIFRDFKTSNVLLDEDYNAKLSDFGLAQDAPMGDKTHVSTEVMGTQGYAAPEYVMTGHLTSKSDVYSFGVVLLEMLTGRKAMDQRRPRKEQNLVEWLRPRLREKDNFHYLMDPKLEGQYPMKSARRVMWLATHCIRHNPKSRPLMSEVVRELKSLPLFHDDNDMVSDHPCPTTSSVSSISISSSSLKRLHVGPSNHGGANKYGPRTGQSPNVPRHFQAYPLPLPNPGVGSSSNPTVASSSSNPRF